MSGQEHPSKRCKIEFNFIPYFSLWLDWADRRQRITTSNLVSTCKELRIGRRVRTTERDVNLKNLDFFESLGHEQTDNEPDTRRNRYQFCFAAVKNGDLNYLNCIITRFAITKELFETACKAAVKLDYPSLYLWALKKTRHLLHPKRELIDLALERSAIHILSAIADYDDLKRYKPKTLATFLWLQENRPGVIEQLDKTAKLSYNVDLLEHLRLLGWGIPYQWIYQNTTSIAKTRWCQIHSPYKLRFHLSGLIGPMDSARFQLICEYHDLNFYSYRQIKDIALRSSFWMERKSFILSAEDYYDACQVLPLEELDKLRPNAPLSQYLAISDFDYFTIEQAVFLRERQFFPGDRRDLLLYAIQKCSYSVCQTLYSADLLGSLSWPAQWSGRGFDAVATWNWLNGLIPIGDNASEFALNTIRQSCISSFSWILERLDPIHYDACINELNAEFAHIEDEEYAEFFRIFYPKLSDDLHILLRTPSRLFTEEQIVFVVENNIEMPPKFQPCWPDNYDFFIKHIEYFPWRSNLRSILARYFNESNFQRYLENEPHFQ